MSHPDCIIAKKEQLRLGILGSPGTGKTTAAHTFPNPINGNLDRKAPPGCQSVPLANADFMRKVLNPAYVKTPTSHLIPANYRDGIKKWLRNALPAMPSGATFILDSWTMLQNYFSIQAQDDNIYCVYDFKTKAKTLNPDGSPVIDKWDVLRHRIVYSAELMNFFKTASCDCIITFHEQVERNEDGKATGQIKALMDGQFKDQITGHLTMFVRQVVIHYDNFKRSNPTDAAYYAAYHREKTGNAITEKTPCYVWQVVASDIFNSILPPGFKCPFVKYMPADYCEYVKFI